MNSSSDDRELLSLIAHEIRSPAAVVAGYLRLLLREDAASVAERARKMIEEADRSCARVLHLVRELSDLSALSGSHVAPAGGSVPLFALCAEVVESAPAGSGSASFSCAPDDQAALVPGDAAQLKRALAALVAATLRERGTRPLEICGFVNRDDTSPEAVIALGDPGLALAPEEVMSAREEQFDRWRGGTGLSVPIACRIISNGGGHLWSLPRNSRAACALSLPIWQPKACSDSEKQPTA